MIARRKQIKSTADLLSKIESEIQTRHELVKKEHVVPDQELVKLVFETQAIKHRVEVYRKINENLEMDIDFEANIDGSDFSDIENSQ